MWGGAPAPQPAPWPASPVLFGVPKPTGGSAAGRGARRKLCGITLKRAPHRWLWVLALAVLGSCRPSENKGAPASEAVPTLRPLNLVLVTIDTLRADRLHCYGYSGIETPSLDRLAQKGVLFENA